jgi:fatty-acyl-CoA synthase
MAHTFSENLLETYAESPERTAIHLLQARQPDRQISFASLVHGAAGVATALSEAGVRPGEVVILILQHGQGLVFAFWGVVLQGAVPSIMPFLTEKLSPAQYRESLAALFEITLPAAVITYADFIEEVRAAIRPGSSIRAILVNEDIPPVTLIDPAKLTGLSRSPQDIVLLQHSSGTTGLQKGVALSHEAVFNQIDSYAKAIHLNAKDVVVSWLPLYHDMGLIAGFILPIFRRIPLVLMSPFEWVRAPARLFTSISHYRGTLAWLPNFAYNFCAQKVRERDLEGVDLSSWRAVINCSEPMHWKSHQLFLQRFSPYGFRPEALATCYAMAENVLAVTQGGIDSPVTIDRIRQDKFFSERLAVPCPEEQDSISMLSAGRPIPNTRLRILDENRNDLPERHIGEIAIQSDCMLTGYYNRPDVTHKAFHEGWFLTGDLGYLSQGEVYVTGRKKELIIVGGKNIYPQDLERIASEVPGVHPGRVVAFGVYNDELGTEEVVIVAEAEQDINDHPKELPQAIADEIRRRVTRGSEIALRYVQIVQRGWLLKTSSGKIARLANRDKYLAEQANQIASEY